MPITVYDAQGNEYEIEIEDDGAASSQPPNPPTNADWAKFRRAEKQAKEAQAALEQMQRQVAFMQAGVNADDPRMLYFVKGYDGKADPEAIKAAAIAAGFMAAPEEGQQPVRTPEQEAALQAQQQIGQANPGATPDATTGLQRIEEAYRAGGTEAMLKALGQEGVPIITEAH